MKYFTANGKYYELRWVNGEVAASSKNMETIVEGGGGGGYAYGGTGYAAPVTIRSRTVVHDEVFLIDREGREHASSCRPLTWPAVPGTGCWSFGR